MTGVPLAQVATDYGEMRIEWEETLGWCAEKAFSSLDQVNSAYQEQLNLFYVLVQ